MEVKYKVVESKIEPIDFKYYYKYLCCGLNGKRFIIRQKCYLDHNEEEFVSSVSYKFFDKWETAKRWFFYSYFQIPIGTKIIAE